MTALVFCAAIGGLQTLLLSALLKGAVNGNMKQTIISFFAKLFVYAVGFCGLYFFFTDSIYYAAAGFIIGVVVSLVVVAVRGMKKVKESDIQIKGDDADGHG